MRIVRSLLLVTVVVALAGTQAPFGAPPSARAAYPGENGKIAFSKWTGGGALTGEIFTIEANGQGLTQLMSNNRLDVGPRWSPDGTRIAWSRDDLDAGWGIWVMNEDGANPQPITDDGFWPTWAPDGKRLAYQCQSGICASDTDGGNEQTIIPAPSQEVLFWPAWSPDGTRIAVIFSKPGAWGLATFNAQGGDRVQLTDDGDGPPSWSPDGSKIMYRTRDSELAILDVATKATEVVAPSVLSLGDWSPDGKSITYAVAGNGLWVANTDGSNPVQITLDGDYPDWQPLPRGVRGVEFTQAIQQLQTVPGLKADLAVEGEPPVPIVAGKPAAMRVYFDEVDETTNYKVEVSGEFSDTKDVTLEPGCKPIDRRRQDGGCSSVDFFFTPPAGQWSEKLEVKDFGGETVFSEEFKLTSLDPPGLVVKYLPICVKLTPGAEPTCPSSAVDTTAPNLIRKLFPVAEDELTYGKLPIPRIVLDAPVSTAEEKSGLTASLRLRYELMTFAGGYTIDQLAGWLPAGGTTGLLGISDPVWVGSTGRVSWQVDTSGTDPLDGQFTLAHEIGHNLGLRHVNLADGCGASDASTDWPYTDSTIQEVGFDVAAGVSMAESKKDLMSYCSPPGTNIWISPHSYNRLAKNYLQPTSIRAAGTGQVGQFLLVRGVAEADGSSASIESAYVIASSVPPEPSDPQGNYCLQFSGGQAAEYCFTLEFEEHRSHQPIDSESFTLRVPLPAGTDRVALMHGADELAALDATASAPSVTIDQPQTGAELSGEETIEWSTSDADGGPLSYAVLYSSDGGDSWLPMAVDASDTELTFDTADLEGDEILVRVLASDGLNTTQETTGPVTLSNGLSGDVDCSGAVNSVDGLKLLRHVAGLSVDQPGDCPGIGTGDGDIFGDVNCDGSITAADALFVLRFVAALPANLPGGCRPVGT